MTGADEHPTRTPAQRLCAGLRRAIELNAAEGAPCDPRTMKHLARVERLRAGSAPDRLCAAIDKVVDDHAARAEADGALVVEFQAAVTLYFIARFVRTGARGDASGALEKMTSLATCNDTACQCADLGAAMGLTHPGPGQCDEFDVVFLDELVGPAPEDLEDPRVEIERALRAVAASR